MQWSPQQLSVFELVQAWLESDEQVFHLFGHAGTGKTTLAKEIEKLIQGGVIFCAYTGKAVDVLHKKGCTSAVTIHSLIYNSRDKSKAHLRKLEEQLRILRAELRSDGLDADQIENHMRVKDYLGQIVAEREGLERPAFILNTESSITKYRVVILDECSMVDGRLGADLLSFGVKVLVLGDPAQLPPIRGTGYFVNDVTPNILLTEIHRQARDNPIIQLATMAREKQSIPHGQYGSSVVAQGRMDPEEVLQFDQILVWKNKTRKAFNNRLRNLLGYNDPLPVVGDKLLCRRNDQDAGLLNGSLHTVMEVGGIMDDKIQLTVLPIGGEFTTEVMVHTHYFLGKDDQLQWFEKRDAQEFDYGYALTVHNAQGSQWDNVMLYDEYTMRKDREKWLYTGITRAAETLRISIP